MFVKIISLKIIIFVTALIELSPLTQQQSSRSFLTQEDNPKIFEQILELFRPHSRSSTRSTPVTEATSRSQVANIDCLYGNGVDYRGKVNSTLRGTACLLWDLSDSLNSYTHPYSDLQGHNYCRNPDDDKGPWCWVDSVAGKFGFCSIEKCKENVVTSSQASEVVVISGQRLVGNEVQVRVNTNWANVCSDSWTNSENRVFCKNLDGRIAVNSGSVSQSSLLISCKGNESDLAACLTNSSYGCKGGPAKANCSQYSVCNEELEMECSEKCVSLKNVCDGTSHCFNGEDEANCEFFEVRLTGGNNRSEGRVELVINGMVGSICDDGWDDADATVVCRMLGYTYGTAVSGGEFGRGKGPIWFDDVTCKGWEEDIQLCQHASTHDCTHFEDAGVTCFRFKNSSQSLTQTKKKKVPTATLR